MLNIMLTRMISGDSKTAVLCPILQVFVANIEFQDRIHEGGKVCVLYCDVTEAKLQ